MTTPVARLPIPGAVQMSLRINQAGQEAVVVLGAGAPSGSAGMTPAKAAAWRDAAWTAFAPLIVGTASCTGALVRDVSGPDGTVWEVGAPASPAGTGGAQVAVASGCTLVKWSTATGGRTGKGRTYLPGLSQTNINADGRTYQSTYAATVAARVTAYLTASVFDLSFSPCVLSFTRGQARTITGGSLAAVIGTQRRRMR